MLKKSLLSFVLLNSVSYVCASQPADIFYDDKAGDHKFVVKDIKDVGLVGTFHILTRKQQAGTGAPIKTDNSADQRMQNYLAAIEKFTTQSTFAFLCLQGWHDDDLKSIRTWAQTNKVEYLEQNHMVLTLEQNFVFLSNPAFKLGAPHTSDLSELNALKWNTNKNNGTQQDHYLHVQLQTPASEVYEVVNVHFVKNNINAVEVTDALKTLSQSQNWILAGDFGCDISGASSQGITVWASRNGTTIHSGNVTTDAIVMIEALKGPVSSGTAGLPMTSSESSTSKSSSSSASTSEEPATTSGGGTGSKTPEKTKSSSSSSATNSKSSSSSSSEESSGTGTKPAAASSSSSSKSEESKEEKKKSRSSSHSATASHSDDEGSGDTSKATTHSAVVTQAHDHHLGQDASHPFTLTEGFSHAETDQRWTLGNKATLTLNMDAHKDHRPQKVEFKNVGAYLPDEKYEQNVTIKLNGIEVGKTVINHSNQLRSIEVELPDSLTGEVAIEFETPNAVSPGSDSRVLGLSFRDVTLTTVSSKK